MSMNRSAGYENLSSRNWSGRMELMRSVSAMAGACERPMRRKPMVARLGRARAVMEEAR